LSLLTLIILQRNKVVQLRKARHYPSWEENEGFKKFRYSNLVTTRSLFFNLYITWSQITTYIIIIN